MLGNIWAGGIHIGTLAVTMAMRGRGFGKQLMEQAELYAVEHGCTMAFLETFSFQARPFYEKLGYRVFGMLEYPVDHQVYFMTKQLSTGGWVDQTSPTMSIATSGRKQFPRNSNSV